MRTKRAGFTLIELLIVIGVLGILAAGLLAAIDPFEQLKKGRDANTRNQVVELHNAHIRYYATHGDFPWYENPTTCPLPAWPQVLNGGNLDLCVAALESDGELKAGFIAAMKAASRTYVSSPSQVLLTICFEPESKSVYYDTNTIFTNQGVSNATNCTLANKKTTYPSGSGQCFWCAK